MRTTVLLLVLTVTSAFGQVRNDQPLTPVVLGAAPARQQSARVATDGTNFYAVWSTRTAANVVTIGGGRLSPAGELLDRPSLFIASGSGLGIPDVVFVGGNFLVVYATGTSVVTRRISREGRFVDPQATVISNRSMYGQLASNGSNVLLLTTTSTFQLLAADGSPLGAERMLPNHGIYTPAVASNGSRYLVAYPSDYASHGSFTILSATGDVVVSKPFPIAEASYVSSVSVTSNGSSFLMMPVMSGRISAMSVDSAGDTGPLRTTDYQAGGTIIATWSGDAYTLAWPAPRADYTAPSQIFAGRLDATGLPLDAPALAISSLQYGRISYAFAIASTGRDTLVVTSDTDVNLIDWRTTAAIFTSLPRLESEPANRRRVAIASSAPEQAGGAMASNGTMSLVTWRERAGFQTVVRAAFLAADGQLGTPIDLGEAHPVTVTAAASDGRDFMVAYVDAHFALVARRVTLEGVLDSTPIVVTPYGTPSDFLAVGATGQAWVVMTAGNGVTISGVAPDGAVIVPRQVFPTSNPADSPAVQCDASVCSATWHSVTPPCYFECPYTENDALVRTDALGNRVAQVVLTDAFGVSPARSMPGTGGQSLFFYSNGKTMFAGRVTASGVVLDTPPVNGGTRFMLSETSYPLQPVVAVNRGLYFVEPDSTTVGRLYWTRIEPDPTPHSTALVNLHQSVALPVTLTASRRNTYLLYSSGETDPQLLASRLFVRTLASPDPQQEAPRRRSTR